MRFRIFRAVEIYIVVLWHITPSSFVAGYQHALESCCLHLQGTLKEAVRFSETLASTNKTTRYHNARDRNLIYCDVHAVGRLFTAVAMQRNDGSDQRFPCGPFQ
jgi:hypothetical protein